MTAKRILVVAAHPDDEVLGCGGTIARHADVGDVVRILILAEGATSRSDARDTDVHSQALMRLRSVAEQSGKLLGVEQVMFAGLPDNRMDSVDFLDVVKIVEKTIDQFNPGMVYTHHQGDLNIDHRITHEAVVTACRPQPGQCVKSLLFFEVPSSTEWRAPSAGAVFLPQWHVDVSLSLTRKLAALDLYADEMRAWPHARSLEGVEHLARWRGASVGFDAAEAFQVGRHIVD